MNFTLCINTYVYTHVYIYVYTHLYIHTYTLIHTYKLIWGQSWCFHRICWHNFWLMLFLFWVMVDIRLQAYGSPVKGDVEIALFLRSVCFPPPSPVDKGLFSILHLDKDVRTADNLSAFLSMARSFHTKRGQTLHRPCMSFQALLHLSWDGSNWPWETCFILTPGPNA